jgi:hypothetical protein
VFSRELNYYHIRHGDTPSADLNDG